MSGRIRTWYAFLLRTVHEATPDESNFVFRDQKRPQINPENRRLVQQGWGEEPIKKNVASTTFNRL
jgi:hypothetical protein